jgi:hypothetical protein
VLEELAAEERERNPGMAVAFSKVYLTNPQLAAKECRAAYRKLGWRDDTGGSNPHGPSQARSADK